MKLIISDFFGVLIDEDGPSFFRQYLHENSHEVADQYFCHGDSGEMTMDEVIHLIAEHYKVDEEFLHNYMYTHPSFHRGYFDKLKEMKKEGVQIALLSNAPSGIVEYFLEKYDAASLFDKIYISYQTHKLKPHKEAFDMVLDDFHLKPEDALFIDDNKKNVDAAASFSLHVIQYKTEEQVISELNSYEKK